MTILSRRQQALSFVAALAVTLCLLAGVDRMAAQPDGAMVWAKAAQMAASQPGA